MKRGKEEKSKKIDVEKRRKIIRESTGQLIKDGRVAMSYNILIGTTLPNCLLNKDGKVPKIRFRLDDGSYTQETRASTDKWLREWVCELSGAEEEFIYEQKPKYVKYINDVPVDIVDNDSNFKNQFIIRVKKRDNMNLRDAVSTVLMFLEDNNVKYVLCDAGRCLLIDNDEDIKNYVEFGK